MNSWEGKQVERFPKFSLIGCASARVANISRLLIKRYSEYVLYRPSTLDHEASSVRTFSPAALTFSPDKAESTASQLPNIHANDYLRLGGTIKHILNLIAIVSSK